MVVFLRERSPMVLRGSKRAWVLNERECVDVVEELRRTLGADGTTAWVVAVGRRRERVGKRERGK